MDLMNAPLNNQYYIIIEGYKCWIDYKIESHKISLLHTEVPKELEGRGIGKILVQKTLDLIKINNLDIIPTCSYIKHFMSKNNT